METLFAKINSADFVENIIVADASYINKLPDSKFYFETFTKANGAPEKRYNYACIGFKYDRARNAFIPPQNYPSWALNETTCLWEAPTPRPLDGLPYRWDEPTLSWVEIS